MATITGTTGNDTLNGGADADVIEGLAGNDTLYGGLGNERLISTWPARFGTRGEDHTARRPSVQGADYERRWLRSRSRPRCAARH